MGGWSSFQTDPFTSSCLVIPGRSPTYLAEVWSVGRMAHGPGGMGQVAYGMGRGAVRWLMVRKGAWVR